MISPCGSPDLLLFSSATSDGLITGCITDSVEHKPIDNAYIVLHLSGGTKSDVHVRTHLDGAYSVSLEPGFYDVLVTAIGFAPKAVKVEVKQGQKLRHDVALKISTVESKAD